MRPLSLNWSREKDFSQYLSVYSSARAMIDSIDSPAPLDPPGRASRAAQGGLEGALRRRACRRIGGEIPAGWRQQKGEVEPRGGGRKEGDEKKWWDLLGLRETEGFPFGLIFPFFFLFFPLK